MAIASFGYCFTSKTGYPMVRFYITGGGINMEGEMACGKCGGNYGTINGQLICVKCGLLAPYQPVTIEKLIAENAELKEDNALLEDILNDLGYRGSHRRHPQTAPD